MDIVCNKTCAKQRLSQSRIIECSTTSRVHDNSEICINSETKVFPDFVIHNIF